MFAGYGLIFVGLYAWHDYYVKEVNKLSSCAALAGELRQCTTTLTGAVNSSSSLL